MQIDQNKVELAIVEQVAGELIEADGLRDLVAKTVERRIDNIFKETADKQISDAVMGAIKAGFERPYRKANSFGQPTGDPTTIAAELEKQVAGYWNQMVDKQGNPADNSYNKTTRAEWVMLNMVASDFHGEMKQHMVNVAASLKDGLRAKLHETVNCMLSDVFRVRSLEDQKINQQNDSSCIHPKAK